MMSRRWKNRLAGVVAAITLLATVPAFAADGDEDLRAEIEALKAGQEAIQRQIELENQIEALQKGQEAMQKDLAEIKRLIQARPAAAPARPAGPNVTGKVFDLGANLVKGEQTAKLTLVEFTDYQ